MDDWNPLLLGLTIKLSTLVAHAGGRQSYGILLMAAEEIPTLTQASFDGEPSVQNATAAQPQQQALDQDAYEEAIQAKEVPPAWQSAHSRHKSRL